jgi:small subunit ribosomal protein S9
MAVKGKTYETHAVGRRKTSVARVYMTSGSGKVTVNHRELKEYFPKGTDRYVVNQPMSLLKNAEKYDVNINVKGGGTTGQAGAIRHGITRALLKLEPSTRPELKVAGFITRDPRAVERKKYGKSGARKSYQFSKR